MQHYEDYIEEMQEEGNEYIPRAQSEKILEAIFYKLSEVLEKMDDVMEEREY